jgi:hypothetical protein
VRSDLEDSGVCADSAPNCAPAHPRAQKHITPGQSTRTPVRTPCARPLIAHPRGGYIYPPVRSAVRGGWKKEEKSNENSGKT